MKKYLYILLFLLPACRSEDDPVIPPTLTQVTQGTQGPIKGFFLLNEANMGSNKASLDYFDGETGAYLKNIFPTRNPGVVQELGDVGNDMCIYGGKLYAAINCSHLVEVMDVNTARHIATISVPNCRSLAFHDGFAYVSSYAGPVQIDPNARLGYVAKIDTATLTVVNTCIVGYQPEEMVVRNDRLYVANSGDYMAPNYDNTVSVIDLNTFTELRKITVAINLHRMALDAYGKIWVSSRGDNKNISSKLYAIDANDMVSKTLDIPVNAMSLCGDSLFICSAARNTPAGNNSASYSIVNVRTQTVITRNFITDGTELNIETPYCVAVNPQSREIFVTDAKDYITPGILYCFTPEGRRKWNAVTGDIPAHIAFTSRRLSDL
ncbi:MAG: YncE family protein [Bacteroidales bacterium]|jgi:hypothetical protein|nr:YncE family protein [Bacteroidales bacterium]